MTVKHEMQQKQNRNIPCNNNNSEQAKLKECMPLLRPPRLTPIQFWPWHLPYTQSKVNQFFLSLKSFINNPSILDLYHMPNYFFAISSSFWSLFCIFSQPSLSHWVKGIVQFFYSYHPPTRQASQHRIRGHDFELLRCSLSLYKRAFVNNCLLTYC